MVQAGRRHGHRRRAPGRARDRQGDGRGAGAGLGRAWPEIVGGRPAIRLPWVRCSAPSAEGDGKAKPAPVKAASGGTADLPAPVEAGRTTQASKDATSRARTSSPLASGEGGATSGNGDGNGAGTAAAEMPRHPQHANISPRPGFHKQASRHHSSGRRGQVLKQDVLAQAGCRAGRERLPLRQLRYSPREPKPKAPPAPRSADNSAGRDPREERVRMTRLRQTIAKRLKEARKTRPPC